jgi:hypothetical protein
MAQYLKPYIDTYFTDAYGTGVGVINPEAKFRVVMRRMQVKSAGS